MNVMRKIILLVLLSIVFYTGGIMAIEEPKYTIESKKEHYEIRRYESTLVAETKIEASFDESGNKAFRILADYIFGNNKSKARLEMTAPVTMQEQSEKITMTAPVSQTRTSDGFLIQFTMPEKFTIDTIPEPNDPRVKIRVIASRKVAAYTYTGSWSEVYYKEQLSKFLSELNRDGVRVIGEPVFARYNSPFQLWFLRRNEILIEVTQ